MLRRLYHDQPAEFAFTPANQKWAEAQITKYPAGRQASAVIPLLWRAQEQEGWLSRPAIEAVAGMLDMAYIRVLEVATFYFMFQLQPVGSVAHIQVCGTLSCMICGAEDLIAVCKEKIAAHAHEVSADGKFSWEEVECLGSCANAPMAQIGKDYYEDLTADRLRQIIDELAVGRVPTPGPQNGRYAAEPLKGLTTLTQYESGRTQFNASVQLASDLGDTVKRIDGTEVPLLTPWLGLSTKTRARNAATDAATKVASAAKAGAGAAAKAVKAGAEAATKAIRAAASDATKPAGKAADVIPAAAKPAAAAKALKPAAAPKAAKPATAKAAPKAAKPKAATPKAAKPAAKPAAKAAAPVAAFAAIDDSAITAAGAGKKPRGLTKPRNGKADDLKTIEGIGPVLETLCHDLGIYHFDQIAAWGAPEVAWMNGNLKGFKGRVSRDKWVAQARLIGEVGIEQFLIRAKTNDY